MIRTLALFALVSFAAVAGAWLATEPGGVEWRWREASGELTIAETAAAIASIALVAALLAELGDWARREETQLHGLQITTPTLHDAYAALVTTSTTGAR